MHIIDITYRITIFFSFIFKLFHNKLCKNMTIQQPALAKIRDVAISALIGLKHNAYLPYKAQNLIS